MTSDNQHLLDKAIELLNNMSAEEFEQRCIAAGLYPMRQNPTDNQLKIERRLGIPTLTEMKNNIFEPIVDKHMENAIKSLTRVAELMDMLNLNLDLDLDIDVIDEDI
ncbi:MAG: hypothetical protein ACXW2E_01355 [Nitrososphaeraceae archaeon]